MDKILKSDLRFDIINTAIALPHHGPIDNLSILKQFPRNQNKSEVFLKKFADKIKNEFGFSTRYWAHLPWRPLVESRDHNSETLSAQAVKALLAQKSATTMDAFVLGSTTNKRYTGSQACAVLGKVGVEAPAWDVKAGCSTSLASLHFAYSLMTLGHERVVVSCAETLSKVIDTENEITWFGMADGAAAIHLKKNMRGAFSIDRLYFSTQGQHVEAFTTPGLLPPNTSELETYGYALKGDEVLLRKLAYENYSAMLKKILDGVDFNTIRWIIPHQVSRQLMDRLIEENRLQSATLVWHAHEIGNIGGSSVLYSLARAWQQGVFNEDGKILLMSVGGGLSYACQILDYRVQAE